MLRSYAAAMAVVLASSGPSCLDKLKGKSIADDGGAEAGAAATASAASSADTAPTAEASAQPTPEELKLPGSCIDPKPDAQKRAKAIAPDLSLDLENVDLDGDGKPDRIYTANIQTRTSGWIYVMRGTCGHFVGEIELVDNKKVTALKSHGLKSLELAIFDHSCAGQCGCSSSTTPFFFNGTKYVSGKSKDTTDKCDGGAKKVLPKCGAGLDLFADDESSPPFCSKVCSSDADCKPGKCDQQGFSVDAKTGLVFTGVGKSVPVCSKGAAPSTPSASAGGGALTVPPGSPAVIPNPKLLDCPAGYTKLMGPKTCNKSCAKDKCPAGTTCQAPMMFCQ